MLCFWLVLDGLWCWNGTHHIHCERHPPILSALIAPPTPSSWPLLYSTSRTTPAYTTASSDEIGSVCLSLLLYGAHVWRRLAEECSMPSQHKRGGSLRSAARMHLAHYLFGMSFCKCHHLLPRIFCKLVQNLLQGFLRAWTSFHGYSGRCVIRVCVVCLDFNRRCRATVSYCFTVSPVDACWPSARSGRKFRRS